MKVLLDECTPRLVKRGIAADLVKTVQEMGWQGVKNGKLLRRAESEFDVSITTDKRLKYEQDLTGRALAIIVLPSNQLPVVKAIIPQLQKVLDSAKPGDFVEVPLPA